MKKIALVLALGSGLILAGCSDQKKTGNAEMTKTAAASAPGTAGEGPGTEALAAFKEFQGLVNAGKFEEAKKHVTQKQLDAMGDQFGMAAGMIAGADLDVVEASPEKVRLSKVTSSSTDASGGTMTMSIKVNMVKEDGAWKISD
ncbi:MAG: hypothetical protein L6R28_08725 [Planctomycetes bacterium]|nr:hypothetical protein [Planctomycetota bacterium]